MINSSLREPAHIEIELCYSGKLWESTFEFKNKIRVKEKPDTLS